MAACFLPGRMDDDVVGCVQVEPCVVAITGNVVGDCVGAPIIAGEGRVVPGCSSLRRSVCVVLAAAGSTWKSRSSRSQLIATVIAAASNPASTTLFR